MRVTGRVARTRVPVRPPSSSRVTTAGSSAATAPPYSTTIESDECEWPRLDVRHGHLPRLHRVGQALGGGSRLRLVAGFDHDAQQGLGSTGANQDAAVAREL